MTKEEIIRMAQEAGLDIDAWEPLYEGGLTGFGVYECTHEELERFAALVASAERESLRESFRVVTAAEASAAILHEREACAKLCAGWSDYTNGIAPTLAKAIRARGQEPAPYESSIGYMFGDKR